MAMTIKFSRQASFTGRNGYFKSSGIELLDLSSLTNEVMISPITSKGLVGRCHISVPLDDLPQFIKELQNLLNHGNTTEKS